MSTPIEPMEAVKVLREAMENIAQPCDAGCGCSFPCRCDCPEAEAINAENMRDIAATALDATAHVEAKASELVHFAWIVVRDSTGEWDGGEPMLDKDEAAEYMQTQCLPGWHLEPLYRAAPQALPATEQAKPVEIDHNDCGLSGADWQASPAKPDLSGLTAEQIDAHLDNILRASGSALRHYSMQKTIDGMRSAMRATLLATQPVAQVKPNHCENWSERDWSMYWAGYLACPSKGKPDAWLWTNHGWCITAHSKHRAIESHVDLCQPPISTQQSPDFISLEPLYRAPAMQAKPDAPQIPLRALYQFAAGLCMDKPALVSVAESARYWFNKCLADPSVMDAFPAPDMAKLDASERNGALEEAATICGNLCDAARKYGNSEREYGLLVAAQEIRARKSVAATTSKPDAGGGA